MYVVSGCPRSGTSLMMDCLRMGLGEDRMLGEKWPMRKGHERVMSQGEDESDKHYEIRIYNYNKVNPNFEEEFKLSEAMNPNGFWECPFTVEGIQWGGPLRANLFERAKQSEEPVFVKVVSQGLAKSNPDYIDRIVYMMRHPRAVAKSQEKLRRKLEVITEDGEKIDLFKDQVVHTPQMFINVTAMAARWLKQHKKPYHVVEFDDLVMYPKETLKGVFDFLEEPGWEQAVEIIEPKLKRSEPQDVENVLWEDAEFMYEKFKAQEFDAIEEYISDKSKHISRQNNSWLCSRSGLMTVDAHCKECRTNLEFRQSLIIHAQRGNIDWRNEPCTYECGTKPDDGFVHLTIEESIEKNFWKTGDTFDEGE